MAVRFDAETDRYTVTAGALPGSSTACTVTWWVKHVVDRNDIATMWSSEDPGNSEYLAISTDTDGVTPLVYISTATDLTGTAMTVGTWYRMAMTITADAGGNQTATLYYASGAGGSLTSNQVTDFSDMTPTTIYIGGSSFAGEWLNGSLANFKQWSTVLSEAQIEADLASYSVINTGSLVRHYKFEVAETTDYSGNGHTLTAGGTSATTDADGPPVGPVPTRPALVADRGTVANTTAATTSAVTLTSPTTIAVGNYLLARVAVDNSGTNGAAPGCTVTDPRSNTWTVLGPALVDPGAAAAGATAYLAYTRVTTAYQAADALTFNWGGISTTAKAIVVEEWSNIAATSPVAVSTVTANAAASTAVSVAITPNTPNQLVYTCLATEGIAGDSITYDADTTNGSWSTLTRTASANATATNNQCVAGQYKVVTAAGAQSWDATITSRDWAALAVVFTPPISLPPPQPIRRLNIGALLDL